MKNIRNFCIIAHIDHGKSTLSDRILEITGTVEKRKMKEQFLDQMDLERERGITIKLQPVRMLWHSRRNTRNNTRNDAEIKMHKKHKEHKDAEGKLLYEDITYKIRGAVLEVKKKLGLGHKESVYHKALEIEFKKQGLYAKSEPTVSIFYNNEKIGSYKPDFIVENKIIVELKALPEIGRPQQEQIWSYLKGSEYKLALLVNFGSGRLDIKRIVYDTAREKNQNFPCSSASSIPRLSASSQCSSAQIQDVFILNLIDTPGHVDFNYEVSRSLAAVEGAILLIDATKGVQAQTLSNLYLAVEQGLEIIPAVNKIDLPNANVEKTKKEIIHILGCHEKDILSVSGKTGEGVKEMLEVVIEKVPSPRGDIKKPLRALIFDSKYDTYKGVLAYVRVVDGEVKRGDEILMMAGEKETGVIETGYFNPALAPCEILKAGDIGYIATGLKSVERCRTGDTITVKNVKIVQDVQNVKNKEKQPEQLKQFQQLEHLEQAKRSNTVKPLEGYKEVKPMVYAGFYPLEGDDYNFMRDALGKLKLNDAAFIFEPESNLALGKGFRCGFLGMLHLEIIRARLEKEFNLSSTVTVPSVVYKVKLKTHPPTPKLRQAGNLQHKTQEILIYSPSDMPDPSITEKIYEPYVKLEIITPSSYLGAIMELMNSPRAEYKDTEYIDQERVVLKYEIPLMDIIINFHDDLKGVSSGFASMNYEVIGYRQSDLVKMNILVAGEEVEALSRIVPRENALREGKTTVKKLKDAIPRQNFAVAVQAAVGGNIIARETIRPFRKDVTSGLYGGDITRKRKLLEKQKKGKKKMKGVGKVTIPPEAFLAALKR